MQTLVTRPVFLFLFTLIRPCKQLLSFSFFSAALISTTLWTLFTLCSNLLLLLLLMVLFEVCSEGK